jgi:hypothetical protein
MALILNGLRHPHLGRPHRPHFGRPHPVPGMSLYLLSPVIAELMLRSMPPIPFLVFGWADILLCGGGVVLIRELAVRWGKGWPTIVAMTLRPGYPAGECCVRPLAPPDVEMPAGQPRIAWITRLGWPPAAT